MKEIQSRPNTEESSAEKKKSAAPVDLSARCTKSPDGQHFWREDAQGVKRYCYCGLILIP